MWCVAKLDEEYIERMEDVLKVYEKPLTERAPVVCLDEKPVLLHEDTRPPVRMRPGQVARRDYEYKRCGTANVFCAVEPKAGRHFTKPTPTRKSPEFADFLLEIAASYPKADTIHLVLDNLSTHSRKAVIDRFGEKAGDWLWKRFAYHCMTLSSPSQRATTAAARQLPMTFMAVRPMSIKVSTPRSMRTAVAGI